MFVSECNCKWSDLKYPNVGSKERDIAFIRLLLKGRFFLITDPVPVSTLGNAQTSTYCNSY